MGLSFPKYCLMTANLSKFDKGLLFMAFFNINCSSCLEFVSDQPNLSNTVLAQSDISVIPDMSITTDDKLLRLCILSIEVSICNCLLQ